jgi:hypothetical protein
VFDIDLPPSDRKFRESEEEAERRRNSATAQAAPYNPKTSTMSAFGKAKAAGKRNDIKV